MGTKNSVGAYVYPPLSVEQVGSKELLKQKQQVTFNLEQLSIFNRLLLTLSIIVKEGLYRL